MPRKLENRRAGVSRKEGSSSDETNRRRQRISRRRTLSQSRSFASLSVSFASPARRSCASSHRSTLTCRLKSTAAARHAAESGRKRRRGRPLRSHRNRCHRSGNRRRRSSFTLVSRERRKGGCLRHGFRFFSLENLCEGSSGGHARSVSRAERGRERGSAWKRERSSL